MIEQFKPMKLKEIKELPSDLTDKIYQLKCDGTNSIIDIELPQVTIYHARDDNWRNRTYRYPEVVAEIQKGEVLTDHKTYLAEICVHDENGIGRHHLLGRRQLENGFQIKRMSTLLPVTIYPHHVLRDKDNYLFNVTYGQQLDLLKQHVKNGSHVQQNLS